MCTSPETSQLSYHQNLCLPVTDTDLRIFQEEFQGFHKVSRHPFALCKLNAKHPLWDAERPYPPPPSTHTYMRKCCFPLIPALMLLCDWQKVRIPYRFCANEQKGAYKNLIWGRGYSVISHFIGQQKVHEVDARHKSIRSEDLFVPVLTEPLVWPTLDSEICSGRCPM